MNNVLMRSMSCLFFALTIATNAFGNEQRVRSVIGVINEEIQEVDRLLRQFSGNNPDLMFRKSELLLERARLRKEIENERYLNLPFERRNPKQKQRIFRESRRDFVAAESVAKQLLSRNPNYAKADQAYYILGFNAKEQGNEKSALEYMKLAEKKARRGSESRIRVENALAEIYFNKRDYPKAIYYYERNLRQVRDKWWTKDAYNLSWAYFRKKRYDQAIKLMKRVNQLSKSQKYVDMSYAAVQDLGLFYAESGKIREGLAFYKSLGQDFTMELITLGTLLSDQGKYPQALNTFNQALTYEKRPEMLAKIYIARIELYDKYDKFDLHLEDSKKLKELHLKNILSTDQKEKFLFQVNKQVGKVQKRMQEKAYRDSHNLLSYNAAIAVDFLDIAIAIDPEKKTQYRFYQAETHYQAKKYEQSLLVYMDAYDLAKKNNDTKTLKLSAEGILAALGQSKSQFPTQDKYIVEGYKRYLAVDSNSKKSEEIYKRLYKYHLDKKDDQQMVVTLNAFAAAFPRKQVEQGKMVNSLVDLYAKSGSDAKLVSLFKDIRTSRYYLNQKTRKDLDAIYQKYEMDNIEKLLQAGQVSRAETAYLAIWSDGENDELTRANAAYNLMVINYRLNRVNEAYGWGVKSIGLMPTKEVIKLRQSFHGVSRFLFERMQFTASADLSHRVFAKTCKAGGKIANALFLNSVYGYQASQGTQRLTNLNSSASQCQVSNDPKYEAKRALLIMNAEEKDYRQLMSYLNQWKNESSLYDDLIAGASGLLEYYNQSGLSSEAALWERYINDIYMQAGKTKKGLSDKSLDIIATIRSKNIESLYAQLQSMKLRFPEDVFNNTLERKIGWLEKLQSEAIALKDIGSGYGIILSFQYLIMGYANLADEVENFTPEGKSEQYITSFKSSMKQIALPLQQKVNEYEFQAKQIIKRNQIMAVGDNRLKAISPDHRHVIQPKKSIWTGGL